VTPRTRADEANKAVRFWFEQKLTACTNAAPDVFENKNKFEICTIDILKMHKSGLASAQTESFFERQNKMASS